MSQYGAPIGGKPPGGPVPPRGYYSPYPPPRRRFGLWFIIFVLFGLLVLSTLSNMGYYLDSVANSGSAGIGLPKLEEIQVENNGASDKILVADVTGIISSLALERSGVNMVRWMDEQLKQAAEDFQIKAVILKVDSPGGEVLASDQIYETILKFQEETGKPVIASMAGLAASGGYYVSAPCRWIVAHPLTITGSIGVIMHGYNYRNLMEKVGVEPNVFKSGRFKDMLSGEKFPDDVSQEEKAMVQEMVDTPSIASNKSSRKAVTGPKVRMATPANRLQQIGKISPTVESYRANKLSNWDWWMNWADLTRRSNEPNHLPALPRPT